MKQLISSLKDLNDEIEYYSRSIEMEGYSLHFVVNSFASYSEEDLKRIFKEDYDKAEEINRRFEKLEECHNGTILELGKMCEKYDKVAECLRMILDNFNNLESENMKISIEDLENVVGGDT